MIEEEDDFDLQEEMDKIKFSLMKESIVNMYHPKRMIIYIKKFQKILELI